MREADGRYGGGGRGDGVLTFDVAVCRYLFAWTGVVNGELRSGRGRGTNVIVRRDGELKMLHEHLSS
jgi:hypothetical protein